MWVGSFAFPICDVTAAAIIVGLYLFPTLFCTIKTGRTPLVASYDRGKIGIIQFSAFDHIHTRKIIVNNRFLYA